MYKIDFGQEYRALNLSIDQCGDVGYINKKSNCWIFALIDGLGHGPLAREAALIAKQYIITHETEQLDNMILGIHEKTKNSRGSVIAICRINLVEGKISYTGIGNISVKRVTNKTTTYVPKDGVIGYIISRPVVHEDTIYNGDVIIMNSDGIKGYFEKEVCEKWKRKTAQNIAQEIINEYNTNQDDASCIVIKVEV